GGSSGCAAVALVEGMCLASVGTDTWGSIRIPSAACGIVGLKPTLGELPCDGITPLSQTCDHVGPMTASVEDARLMFEVLTGRPASHAPRPERRLTFGVPSGYLVERLDSEVRQALTRVRIRLSNADHAVIDLPIEDSRWAPDVYLHIVLPEASWYHAPQLDSDPSGYSPGIRLRLEMGRYLLAEDYVRAMQLRTRLTSSVDDALERCDVLLLPSLPIAAPPLGAATVDIEGTEEPVRAATLRLTQLFNLTGHPAISLPAGVTNLGLPIGIQLVAARGQTDRLLTIAAAVETQMTGGLGSVGGGEG
ncbi:MAG: amidase, partial [Vicinamibacterales bacterium]